MALRSHDPGRPDVAPHVELSLAGELAVVDDLVDRVVHVGELSVAQLDPAHVLERDPAEVVRRDAELRHVPRVNGDASIRPRRTADHLEHGVEAPDVRVERHELVDDLRIRTLGGCVTQLAEALAELRQRRGVAGDVPDLDVMRVERGGGGEEQVARRSEAWRRSSPGSKNQSIRNSSSSRVSPLSSIACFISARVSVSSTCSRSACQIPSPAKPTFRASAQRSAQLKRLHSRPKCTTTGPETVQ